jgi:large subunit ribosomal protein L4e
MMEANVYHTDGKVEKKVALPKVFENTYNEDIVRRALLAEQSNQYQPQGHDVLAGMRTSAKYVGRYGTYRTLRHVGRPARPRQVLAKGAMGEVRRIPSAVKGRHAHPHMVEKVIVERINRKEYAKALECAVAATANASLVKKNYTYSKDMPIVVSSSIEKISKAKELLKVLNAIGLTEDLERSHDPKTKEGRRRSVKKRYFRSSALIVVKDSASIGRAGRNIAGVDVVSVDRMRIEVLAPGAKPRLAIWSEAAISALPEGIQKSTMSYKQ